VRISSTCSLPSLLLCTQAVLCLYPRCSTGFLKAWNLCLVWNNPQGKSFVWHGSGVRR
jgi:hypothetical protein